MFVFATTLVEKTKLEKNCCSTAGITILVVQNAETYNVKKRPMPNNTNANKNKSQNLYEKAGAVRTPLKI